MNKLKSATLENNIWKMYVFQSLSRGGLAFPLPVIVLFWQANGLNLTQVMGLQSIFALTVVLLEIPSGYFADLIGRKVTLICSAVAMTLDLTIYMLSSSFLHLIGALSSKHAHRLEEWLGQKYALILPVIALGTSYLLMSNLIFLFSFIFAFLQQFVRGFSRVVLTDYVNKLAISDIRATVLSVQSLLGRLIYAAFILIAGWIADGHGLIPALTLVGVVTFIVGGITLVILSKNEVF